MFSACLFGASQYVSALPAFSEVTPLDDGYFSTPIDSDFWVTSLAPADVDADGDLDLAVLGYSVVYNVSATEALLVLRNDGLGQDGRWRFTPQPMDMGELYSGSSDLAWGDFDGDGDHDLLVGTEGMTRLYRNDAGQLSDSGLSFPGYLEDSSYSGAYDLRSITWADADNDGDLDVFLPTTDGDAFPAFDSVLMRNDGPNGLGGWVFTEVRTGFDVGVNVQTSWIDDDSDGDLDLMVANVDPTATPPIFGAIAMIRRALLRSSCCPSPFSTGWRTGVTSLRTAGRTCWLRAIFWTRTATTAPPSVHTLRKPTAAIFSQLFPDQMSHGWISMQPVGRTLIPTVTSTCWPPAVMSATAKFLADRSSMRTMVAEH